MKNWNWSSFFFVTCIGAIGGLSNKSIENTWYALVFGLSVGAIFGLLFAYALRKD